MAEIERQVTTSNCSCERNLFLDSYDRNAFDVQVGADLFGHWQEGGGFRYQNITIPQGSTILSAKLSVKAYKNRSGTVCNSKISAEDVDDAAIFPVAKGDFDTRYAAHTTAVVNWDSIAAWTMDTWYDSPDITSVIQEIIDRVGWSSGNDIVIFWEDFDDRSDHNDDAARDAYGYPRGSANTPKLIITYQVIELPEVQTDPATEIT